MKSDIEKVLIWFGALMAVGLITGLVSVAGGQVSP